MAEQEYYVPDRHGELRLAVLRGIAIKRAEEGFQPILQFVTLRGVRQLNITLDPMPANQVGQEITLYLETHLPVEVPF